MKRIALLFSHLPKHLCGQDLPIVQMKAAISFLKSQNVTVITSAGQTHWDCILTALLDNNIPVHPVIVKPMTLEEISEQFSYSFESYTVTESWEERDRFICFNAECVYPLWLRKNGHLAKITALLPAEQIDRRFDCSSYRFSGSALKYLLGEPSTELCLLPDDYLWHWTRSKNGVWNGETRREFCNDLLCSQSAPRNALATLLRILQERKIRAGNCHIAGNIFVTAFTENHPACSANLFTWRRDWQRMNFEPYGIGIPRDYACLKGVRLLKYGDVPGWDTMQSDNRWKYEREWRVRGDFLLDDECTKNMIVVVRKTQEIEHIRTIFTGRAAAYEQDN
ncbi:MAG: hypothetical protein LBU34_05560 [Planctomycetaceae bacterium]|jgi:hypothetical protein|nr:hypothetical protein [Planctomycetaceae bacterium]